MNTECQLDQQLARIMDKIRDFTDKVCSGPYWKLKVMALTVFCCLMTTSPPPRTMAMNQYAELVELRMEEPYLWPRIDGFTHEANLKFRLTMPYLARGFGLRIVGAKFIEMFMGCLTFFIACSIFSRWIEDRQTVCWLTVACGLIYAGKAAFLEYSCTYDGFGVAWLMVALIMKRPTLAAFSVFFAAWTDERGLVASSLVCMYYMAEAIYHQKKGFFQSLLVPRAIACYVAWISYFSLRFWLAHHFDLYAYGNDAFSINFHTNRVGYVMGLLTGFEGLWLIVVFSIVVLWKEKRWLTMVAFLICMTVVSIVAFCVLDCGRSLTYILPALGTAVLIVGQSLSREALRRCALIALGGCIFWPTYMFQSGRSWYIYGVPLPMSILDWHQFLTHLPGH